MPRITVGESEFHYELDDFTDPWTDADTVLIQHAFGRSGRFWYQWVPDLAREFRVVRRDSRGHGQSEDPGPDYEWSVEGLIADLMGFMDALGLESVHYVGDSIGGMVGLACASSWPERFRTLTLSATPESMLAADAPARDDQLAVGMGDRDTAFAELGVGNWAVAMMTPGKFAGLDGSDERREWLAGEWDRTPVHVAQRMMRAVRGFDVTPLLPSLEVPTLVLAAPRSSILSLERQVRLYEALPDARLAVIEGPGHEIYFDRAEDCLAAVIPFLREHRGR